jgi:hypothetical protein
MKEPGELEASAASLPFRFVFKLFMRETRCEACGGELVIVWLRRFVKTGWRRMPSAGLSYRSEYGDHYNYGLGYECSSCGRITNRSGMEQRTAV